MSGVLKLSKAVSILFAISSCAILSPAFAEDASQANLRVAAQKLIDARKQFSIAEAQVKAAEAEYKLARQAKKAIALREAANNMGKEKVESTKAKEEKAEKLVQNLPRIDAEEKKMPQATPDYSTRSIDELDMP